MIASAGRTGLAAANARPVARPVARQVGSPAGYALLYLAFPNAIYLLGWLEPWAAMLGAAAMLLALGPAFRDAAPRGMPSGPGAARLIVLLAVACAWSALGGAGHLFFANQDWVVRDAVLRDLVVGDWPVGYPGADGQTLLLRSPIAYYLPAALFGKLFGLAHADLALLAWTALGVWLLLAMVTDRADSTAQVVAKVLLVVLFSGMDVAGTLLAGHPVRVTGHMEWWAALFQYSSTTTQLFWVPGHALPGWLAAAFLVRRLDDASMVRLLPALLAMVPLWSPLTALGIVPLAVAALVHRTHRHGFRGVLDLPACAGAGVIVVLVTLYITGGASRIPSGWIWASGTDPAATWTIYFIFILLEVAVPLLAVTVARRTPLVVAAGATLLLLPTYRFGPSNDLAMRASIPALMVVALALAQALPSMCTVRRQRPLAVVAALVLAIGACTPFSEFARALASPRWAPDAGSRVVDVTQGDHYLAPMPQGLLARLLKPLHLLPAGPGRGPRE